jgi:4-hydroxybenzoate polyprenyltransferase
MEAAPARSHRPVTAYVVFCLCVIAVAIQPYISLDRQSARDFLTVLFGACMTSGVVIIEDVIRNSPKWFRT